MKLTLTGDKLTKIGNAIAQVYIGAGPNAIDNLNAALIAQNRNVFEYIVVHAPFPLQVLQLLERANREGWLLTLLNAVHEHRPEALNLQELLRSCLDTVPAEQVLDLAAGAQTISEPVRAELQVILPGTAIAQLDTLQRRIRAVCRVDYTDQSPPGAGTGFLVGPDLVLTSWHVLKRVIEAPNTAKHLQFHFDLLSREAAGLEKFPPSRGMVLNPEFFTRSHFHPRV